MERVVDKETILVPTKYSRIYNVLRSNRSPSPYIAKYFHQPIMCTTEYERMVKVCAVPNVSKYIQKYDHYIIMRAIEGVDLFDHICARAVPLPAILAIVKQLIRIVSDIHAKGVIHGDIKLENIIYNESDGEIHLIDFGTECTAMYAPPEWALEPSVRRVSTDVWGIGIVAYMLLTRMHPFNSIEETLKKSTLLYGRVRHTGLEMLIGKCLQKTHTARPTLAELGMIELI
jgi:serine/threonine protein kinase